MKHDTDETHDYNEPWDKSDVTTALHLRRQGWTYRKIAEHMGRTEAGVQSKLYRLRMQDLARGSRG